MRASRTLLLALGLLAALGTSRAARAVPARLQRPQAGDTAVRMGVAISPETVTVGLPFRVQLRLRAPRGSTMEFPIV